MVLKVKGGSRMRRIGLIVPFAVLFLVAAACTTDDDGGGGDGGGGEDTGSVTVFSAMEPFEAEALNAIIDEQINAQVDYVAEVEASAEFEEQVQIRIEGGNPPDVAMYPQPGAVLEQAAAGTAISLEDLGFTADELNATFGEYFLSLGEFEGEHYGIPTNINLKSLIWYAKDDFDAAGYTVPATF